ncbi:MAG TPA: Crp/Fnr family transcriptional regulator [Coleofasciculaceae cyanobacterium]|jgi:CRP-like cAMP-binding protein
MIINTLPPKKLHHNLKRQTFVSGEFILLKPNSYWLLQQGIVKSCTYTEEGTPVTLGYWGVDDLIGQPLSLVYPYKIECLTPVEALCIPINQTHRITNLIQRHIQQTEEILYILRSDKVGQRLRGILVWLGHKFGQEIEIGHLIDLRLTHQDLAEIIGATRVTVTKIVNQLEQEGFLSRPHRNTFVISKLQEI